MAKRTYNTPKRTCVIKVRLTEEEKSEFDKRCEVYGLSQSEFIRQAISTAKVKTTIRVSPVNEETLEVFGELCAQLGKLGSNLNANGEAVCVHEEVAKRIPNICFTQIAHCLNAGGCPDAQTKAELYKITGSLANLKYQILKEMGERLGNDQAYRI